MKHVKNGIKRSKISDEIKNQLDQLLMLAVEYSSFTAEFLSSINIDRFFAVIDHINTTLSQKSKNSSNGRY